MIQIPHLSELPKEWSPIRKRAHIYSIKELNRLEDALRELCEEMAERGVSSEYNEEMYNLGGQMIFHPPHQGGGFSGEFSDDHWVAPLYFSYSNGSVEEPTVEAAIEKAFIAGAKWQKSQSK